MKDKTILTPGAPFLAPSLREKWALAQDQTTSRE